MFKKIIVIFVSILAVSICIYSINYSNASSLNTNNNTTPKYKNEPNSNLYNYSYIPPKDIVLPEKTDWDGKKHYIYTVFDAAKYVKEECTRTSINRTLASPEEVAYLWENHIEYLRSIGAVGDRFPQTAILAYDGSNYYNLTCSVYFPKGNKCANVKTPILGGNHRYISVTQKHNPPFGAICKNSGQSIKDLK